MPGFALAANASVICAHGGKATAAGTQPRVLLSGQPALSQALPMVVAGCANPPPPSGIGPCITAQWLTGSVRVLALGVPLVLQDSQAVCVPTGTPLSVLFSQTRVRAM